MALGSARAPDDEALVGDGALHHGQQGDSGVQVPSSCTHGLYGGDDAARGSAGRGSGICASTGVDFGKGSDAPCTTPPVPDGAEQVPPSGGAWSFIMATSLEFFLECISCGSVWKGLDYQVPITGHMVTTYKIYHGLRDRPGGQVKKGATTRTSSTRSCAYSIFLTTNVYGGGLMAPR